MGRGDDVGMKGYAGNRYAIRTTDADARIDNESERGKVESEGNVTLQKVQSCRETEATEPKRDRPKERYRYLNVKLHHYTTDLQDQVAVPA